MDMDDLPNEVIKGMLNNELFDNVTVFNKEIAKLESHGETAGVPDMVNLLDAIGCLIIGLHSRIELLSQEVEKVQEKQSETDAFRFN